MLWCGHWCVFVDCYLDCWFFGSLFFGLVLFVCLVGWLLVAGCLVFGVVWLFVGLFGVWCCSFLVFVFAVAAVCLSVFFPRLETDLLVAGRRPAKFGDGMHGGWWALWSSTWEKSLLREGWEILSKSTSCLEGTILDSSLQCRVRLKALKLQGLSN